MKFAITLALVSATAVSASPYYVGENLTPKNHITLGFNDTPTKKDAGATAKTGNIMALDLDANYNVTENVPVRLNAPIYFINKNATTTSTSRNSFGNIQLGTGWNMKFVSSDQSWNYGYAATIDTYLPTSRKDEADRVAQVNPSTDLYRYATKTTTALPTLGLFAGTDIFSAKVNLGLAYSRVSTTGVTDKNRLSMPAQVAATWHALPNLHLNAEYNAIALDTATASTGKRLRHGMSPSISGNYEALLASAYVTVPFDSTTRDLTAVSFGLNAGYSF